MQAKRRSIQGISLVSMLIGTLLLSAALVSTLNLASFVKTSARPDEQYEYTTQLAALGEILSARIALGGGSVTDEDTNQGIRICVLNGSGTSCGAYSGQTSNLCVMFPTRVGQGESSSIEVQGIRLRNGVMQERDQQNVNLPSFSFASFCRNSSAWRALHSSNDFRVQSVRFCKFAGNVVTNLSRNYESSCPSILDPDQETNSFWLTLIKIRPAQAGSDEIMSVTLNALLNSTRVTTL